MILPLTHDRMTLQRLPWVTLTIVALNFIVFLATWPRAVADYARTDEVAVEIEAFVMHHPDVLEVECERCPDNVELDELVARWEQSRSEHIFSRYGYVPARPTTVGLFGSLFLHAGWMHLLSNMYLLWLCGLSIEDIWGRPLYAVVYLLGGMGAALAHASFQPESLAHLVGASGAIAALMGIFCVRCWNTSIRFFYWFFLTFFGTFTAPAWIMLILWLTRELFYAFVVGDAAGVAFWAHIGGFGLGAGFALVMRATGLEERFIAPAIERKTNLVSKHPGLARALEFYDAGDYQKAVSELVIAVREDREDPDLYHLLGSCCEALSRPVDAARWRRKELAIHVRRREHDLVVLSYHEILAIHPDAELDSRELFAVAGAFAALDQIGDAASLYRKLLAVSSDPLQRLRAGVALAEIQHRDGRTRDGLRILDEIAPLAATLPEWQSVIEEKRQSFAAVES
jgi:membrane associated rhomboid family serine protease